MKLIQKLLLLLLFLSLVKITSAQQNHSIAIIPKPVHTVEKPGNFVLTPSTKIIIKGNTDSLSNEANYLADRLSTATWSKSEIIHGAKTVDSAIVLNLDASSSYENKEAYKLSVNPRMVTITAPSSAGVFYGIQSLLQLLPPAINLDDPSLVPQDIKWTIPAVQINDYPRFVYRGMHLDVCRHFMPVGFVKKYIDLMAMQKLNRFHWHLTDDQGWRIQIKKYPKLTEIGAWRDSTLIGRKGSGRYDHKKTGGFYTQDQIKEVVKYARKRHVTIIPEIEMPGHASAALTAYPELGCQPDKNYHLQSTWGVFEDIYCPSEKTFTFLENVLREVIDLFPSKYIHIGGDEAPKTAWENSDLAQEVIKREGLENEHELQSYFITRIEKFLNKHGRNIIGWDEILEGGLAPNATVMSWRGTKGGIEAAKQHHDVIMTPNKYLYLDYYQADRKAEPLTIGGYVPMEKVYNYEPISDELSKEEGKYILGVQANVWTEYMQSPQKVEYMAYPRASALAEVDWSPKESRDWDGFLNRMQVQFQRFDAMDVNAAQHYRKEYPLPEKPTWPKSDK